MTEFSDIIATIDNFKVETFTRFRHLLQSIGALQADCVTWRTVF